jgi:hypothetical protein
MKRGLTGDKLGCQSNQHREAPDMLYVGLVRHEAPYDRVGWNGSPPGCRSSPVKLEAA